jgi:hypothetical protein
MKPLRTTIIVFQVGVEGGEDPGMHADLLNDEDLPAEVILPPKQASKRKPAALVEAQADVEIEMLPPPAKKPSVQVI